MNYILTWVHGVNYVSYVGVLFRVCLRRIPGKAGGTLGAQTFVCCKRTGTLLSLPTVDRS